MNINPPKKTTLEEEQMERIPAVIQLLRAGVDGLCTDLLSDPKWKASAIVPELKSMLGFFETLALILHSMPEESVRESLRNTIKTILKHCRILSKSGWSSFAVTSIDPSFALPVFIIEAARLTGPAIRFSPNNMKAWITIDRDFKDILSQKSVIESLQSAGIKNGIIKENFKSLFEDNLVEQEVLIAQGTDPICGQNGKFVYCIHIHDLGHIPKLLEDGRVSFKDIQLFEYVSDGSKLARIDPPTPGKPGYTVTGQEIIPPAVQEAVVPKLKYTILSEDGQFLLAKDDCCVSKQFGQIHLEPVVRIVGDVSYESGNIDSQVSVVIGKDVQTGFSVRSKKDIEVTGLIEGADIFTEGILFAKGGIQGKDKGTIEVHGDLHAKFISNASIVCMGNVTGGKEIMHSEIHAEGRVLVSESPARIMGGEIHSEMDIVANEIGSELGIPTKLVLGGKVAEFQKLIQENETEIEQKETMLENCRQIQSNLDMQLTIQSNNEEEIQKAKLKAQEMMQAVQDRIQELYQDQELLHIQYEDSLSHPRTVRARKAIWHGTTIQISGNELVVKDATGPATVLLKGNEISILPYSELSEAAQAEK